MPSKTLRRGPLPAAPAHLYTGPANQLLAEALATNLCPPAQVHALHELPAPDPRRTQRLRTERAELRRALARDEQLELLAGPHTCLHQELAELRADMAASRARLAEIDALIGPAAGTSPQVPPQQARQEGGPQHG